MYTGKNLADKVLSGALASDADFSKTVMSNVTMTKSYAKGANFSGEQACYLLQAFMCPSFVALPYHHTLECQQASMVLGNPA